MARRDDSTASSELPGDVRRWRNIGIVAHINAGKTTLSERILFDTGRQRFCGDVDAGTATMDWHREEQERGISIEAAVTDVPWRGHRIQLVDTPGHVDFTAEVERSLRVLDGAIVVIDGVRGVEPQTEAVWRLLERLEVPRLAFINKLDRPSADFTKAVRSMGRLPGCRTVPVVVPLPGGDGGLGGLLDAVGRRHACWNALEPSADHVAAAHAAVVEACADLDDRVVEAFVERGEIGEAVLHDALRRGTWGRAIVPVFAGSALRNRGVEPLLDGVCRYLPSPLERISHLFPDAPAADADALVGFVFKVEAPEVGELPIALVRVFRGHMDPDAVIEDGEGRPAPIRGLQSVHGGQREPIRRADAGSIVGVRAERPLATGETLRAPGTRVVLEPIRFSDPVLTIRLEPRVAGGMEAIERAAVRLATGDPTLDVRPEPETGGLLVTGMGELHLDVFRERLERAVGDVFRVGPPAVMQFESISRPAEGFAECVRAVGDRQIRATARVRVEPAAEHGVSFRWVVPSDPAGVSRQDVLAELAQRAISGLSAPLPARDLVIEVAELTVDGPAEMVAPLALEAAALACRRAVDRAAAVRLEPRVRFVVEVPNDNLSGVLADLRSRAARIDEIAAEPAATTVRGTAFLRELIGYATPLRSMTRGRARFELHPAGLAAIPGP